MGSVLIAALAFLTQNITLPLWAAGAAGLYLAIVTVVTLYDPAARTYRWLAAKGRLARLAASTRPRIEETLTQLKGLMSSDNAGTVLYVVKEATHWDELRVGLGLQLHDVEHLETLKGWLLSLESRLDRYGGRAFVSLCHELAALIGQYNRFFLLRHRALQEAVTAGKLSEPHARYLKQQWNVNREGHAQFIRKWTEVSTTINDSVRIKVCIDYYEALGTIE